MRSEHISKAYDRLLAAICDYVDAEKESTKTFMDSDMSTDVPDAIEIVEGQQFVVGEIGTRELYEPQVDPVLNYPVQPGGVIYLGYDDQEQPREFPKPRENITLQHDYEDMAVSCVLTGDLKNLSDMEVGRILGEMVAAFLEVAD